MRLKDGFKGERSLVLPKALTDLIERDPLASSIYITDIGYYPHAAHHYRKRETAISQFVFIYCVDGCGWYRVKGTKYDVHAGNYFILPAGEAHEYGASEENPWSIYWIHFSGRLAPYYAADCLEPHEVLPSAASRINVRNSLFDEIFNTLHSSFAIESIRYAMASFHHYLASLRYLEQFRRASQITDAHSTNPHKGISCRADKTADIAKLADHFFRENLGRTLTLSEMADYLGLSPSHFSSLFRRTTGHSPLQYFNLLKVQQACQLLDHTDMTIAQISLQLGLDDPYYFSRLFSKTMGLSPRAYRSRLKP